MRAENCFHCGEGLPAGDRLDVVIAGKPRPMCCAGCAAVAQTIVDGGLESYYRERSALPQREFIAPEGRGALEAYDLDDVQKPFVRRLDGDIRQATLLVEGIRCGACALLIERRLQGCEGVRSAAVNLSARRLHVDWNDARIRLSAILRAVNDLGYRTQGFDTAAGELAAGRERRRALWRMFVAGFAMMQVMMYALPAYFSAGEMTPDASQLMRWASFALTVPVILWSAGPFFSNAWRDLRAGRAGMDVPVALGIAVAFAASAWATVSGRGEVYFDSIVMFVFLLLGARYLEALARSRAAESQRRLTRGTPAIADRLIAGADPSVTERVAVAALARGDRVRIAPGGVIPADGTVIAGHSAADESLLTGEARPVVKQVGDFVIGGSLNLASPLTVEVARVGPESMLAGIVRLMDRAQSERPRIAQVADRIAQGFVAALLAVALATAVIWYFLDPGRALWVMVAVLVVSCPCALSLATPAALAAATDTLHRLGILVTRGHALETLAKVTHVVFDKTGTLTRGRPSLTGVIPLGILGRDACVALAAALERGSEHPVARPFLAAAADLAPVTALEIRNHPGRGVEAVVNGRRVRIGSPAFAEELVGRPLPGQGVLAAGEANVVTLADEAGYLAFFALGDAPRPGAQRLVRGLEARGKAVCLLSGDRRETALHVARQLGIGAAVGEAVPESKLAFVRELQARGAVVAMVGDGINDAPVLAQAQVSIAMGGGTDLAHASADMVFLVDDLERLLDVFDLAQRTMGVIRQNLAWAAAYNVVAIPLAVAGWVTPLIAGTGMALSSLGVVANALRLLNVRRTGNRTPVAQAEPPLPVMR